MGKKTKILKGDLKVAIQETGGNVTQMSERFSVSRQTIYNLLDKYKYRDMVDAFRRRMFEIAEGNVFDAVAEGDIDMSKFVLTHFPGGVRWSSKQDIDVTGIRVSDEARRLMELYGVSESGLGDQLEKMLQAMHSKKLAEVDGE